MATTLDPRLTNHKRFAAFKNRGFGDHLPTALQLLRQTVELLDSRKVWSCLISGTLLGHIRHKAIIPWDDDIDLIADAALTTRLEDLPHKMAAHAVGTHLIKLCYKDGIVIPNQEYTWPFIDIFLAPEIKPGHISFFGSDWSIDKFLPLQPVDFMGIRTFIPRDPIFFLTRNYGEKFMTVFYPPDWDHRTESSTNLPQTAICLDYLPRS